MAVRSLARPQAVESGLRASAVVNNCISGSLFTASKSEVESGCLAFVSETVHERSPLLQPAIMPLERNSSATSKNVYCTGRWPSQGFS